MRWGQTDGRTAGRGLRRMQGKDYFPSSSRRSSRSNDNRRNLFEETSSKLAFCWVLLRSGYTLLEFKARKGGFDRGGTGRIKMVEYNNKFMNQAKIEKSSVAFRVEYIFYTYYM